ncbi:MAG: HAD-IIA family hydrolase [Anaerolineae bacterium]|nr:HAD-IIA family hydrolase [Anaerolineae bacterium]MDW8098978.1 HAD-IIA family hydrolase [Anaerolineae bacterium]
MTTPSLCEIRGLILDMDGVIYAGNELLPGAREFISHLQATGTPFLFLTNNSSRTPGQYVEKLASLGIYVGEERIFTSALATAAWLKETSPAGAGVLVIGERGVREALAQQGFRLVDDHQQAQYVVVGFDSTFTYAKAREAALAIQKGALLIATNTDASLPTEHGEIPGAGSIVAMLETATGVKARVIGKPEPNIFKQALTRLGTRAEETAVVGDRYETDIVGGHRAGLKTIGMLCGVTDAQRFATADPRPNWIFAHLGELLTAWRKTHASPIANSCADQTRAQ